MDEEEPEEVDATVEEVENAPSGGSQTRATRKPADRRHWATRIGVSFDSLKDPAFKALYPFESRLFEIRNLSYHYVDEGEGEPVVMVHGNPTWSFFYRKLIVGLRSDYRCMAADHMGCGLSEKPWKYGYDLARHITNLEAWLESSLPPAQWNGGKINLIVHDWGGPIGFGYAALHPERIRRIIVLNTSIFAEGDLSWRIKVCGLPVIGDILVRRLNLFAKLATTKTTVKQLAEQVRNAYVLPYNSPANRIGILKFIQDIPFKAGTPTHKRFKRIAELAEKTLADKPMLVQWGMKDWCFTPFFLELWKKRFPKAEVDEYQAGHYLLEDAGEDILARIREFLRKPAP